MFNIGIQSPRDQSPFIDDNCVFCFSQDLYILSAYVLRIRYIYYDSSVELLRTENVIPWNVNLTRNYIYICEILLAINIYIYICKL